MKGFGRAKFLAKVTPKGITAKAFRRELGFFTKYGEKPLELVPGLNLHLLDPKGLTQMSAGSIH